MAEAEPALLRFDRVGKRFGGTLAIDAITLDLHDGEVLALLGENGAGKSTLIKVLAGIHSADAGSILYRGTPHDAARSRVAFIHQDLGLIEWMTVAENVALALGYPRRRGRIDWHAAARQAAGALARVGMDIDPTTRVRELTRTEKSLVAIARALAADADVLVLDEPTASLPADEVERLFAALRPLRARGVGIIYVSHRLDEVFAIADRVAVLRDGRLVGVRAIADTTPDTLIELIVGRALDRFEAAPAVATAPLLAVLNLIAGDAGPVSFDVARGEIVALVGLRGAGQEAIGRALFGARPHTGTVRLDGGVPDLASPRAAMACGIGLIARDRGEESCAAGLTIRENTFINPGATGRAWCHVLSPGTEAGRAYDIGREVGLSPNAPGLPIEALSGGNQQKVVVGRWLATARKLLVAEDPTAGVDVGAKAEIYRLIAAAAARGLGVVVVSTDFEEVARLCRRALVFSRGRIVDELAGSALTIERLIDAASVSRVAA